jgi:hypothetical protein
MKISTVKSWCQDSLLLLFKHHVLTDWLDILELLLQRVGHNSMPNLLQCTGLPRLADMQTYLSQQNSENDTACNIRISKTLEPFTQGKHSNDKKENIYMFYLNIYSFLSFFKKALTVLRGPLAYPNGLLDLHIETFGKAPWPGDQPNARPLPTQDNTTQKHVDTYPCPSLKLHKKTDLW